MIAVILAGGTGTRMWPMSRKQKPKQFFEVIGERVLIRDTYDRLRKSFPEERIYFSVSPAFDAFIREHFPNVPDDRIIIEPDKRDTGPAMGYAAAWLSLRHPDEPIVFVPSDHHVGDERAFLRCLVAGGDLVKKTGKLVDIGIAPTFPSTVLGYTRIGELEREVEGIEVYAFAGHTEKPAYPVAKAYVDDGSYLWHANYYMWTPEGFLGAFDRHAPEFGKVLRGIQEALRGGDRDRAAELFRQLPKTSIDYAVTEHMGEGDLLVIKGEFGWSDIGAWDVLYDRLSSGQENVTKGPCIAFDTTGSIVYAPEGKLVAVMGMHDIVVVDTEDALLVCHRKDSQRLKQLIERIEEGGHSSYL